MFGVRLSVCLFVFGCRFNLTRAVFSDEQDFINQFLGQSILTCLTTFMATA